MQIVLAPEFTAENWPEVDAFYQQNADRDSIHFWDMDMRQVPHINSMLLGMLVAFNAVIENRGGKFRLLLAKGSKTAEVIRFAKIHRIINVRES
jgi:anti-anti-sigma regulatory factor